MFMFVLYYTLAGEDHNRGCVTFNVPAGVTMQPLTINIMDNNVVECNEMFNVTMVSVTTCGVTIGSYRISELIIRDDDGKYKSFIVSVTLENNVISSIAARVSLSQSQYSVVESNNSLTVTIKLSGRTSEDVIVEVTISNGSANGNVE